MLTAAYYFLLLQHTLTVDASASITPAYSSLSTDEGARISRIEAEIARLTLITEEQRSHNEASFLNSLNSNTKKILTDNEIDTEEVFQKLTDDDINDMFTLKGQQLKVKTLRDSMNHPDKQNHQQLIPFHPRPRECRVTPWSNQSEDARQRRGAQAIKRFEHIVDEYRKSDNGSWTQPNDQRANPATWASHNPAGLRFLRDNLFFIDSILAEGIDQSSSNILMDLLLDAVADARLFRTIQPAGWVYTYWENKFFPAGTNTKVTSASNGIFALIYIVGRDGGEETMQRLHDRRDHGAVPRDNDRLNAVYQMVMDQPDNRNRIRDFASHSEIEKFVNIFNEEDAATKVIEQTEPKLIFTRANMIRDR